jgi:hypothetical protein
MPLFQYLTLISSTGAAVLLALHQLVAVMAAGGLLLSDILFITSLFPVKLQLKALAFDGEKTVRSDLGSSACACVSHRSRRDSSRVSERPAETLDWAPTQ